MGHNSVLVSTTWGTLSMHFLCEQHILAVDRSRVTTLFIFLRLPVAFLHPLSYSYKYADCVVFFGTRLIIVSFRLFFCSFPTRLSQADDGIVRAAFRRLTQPAKGATYTPSELVVLLNRFDYTGAGVPIKRLTRALSLCLENKVRSGTEWRKVVGLFRERFDVRSWPCILAGPRRCLPLMGLLLVPCVMSVVGVFCRY